MFNHLFDYKKGNRPFNELNSSGVLLPTFKPVLKNNLICCRTGFMWVVKCATSLFNPGGGGVLRKRKEGVCSSEILN